MGFQRDGRWGLNVLAVLVVGVWALPSPGSAQIQATPSEFHFGGVFESYRFSDEGVTGIRSVSMFSLPVRGALSLGRYGVLDIRGAFARGSLEASDGGTFEISGLTDTELRLGFRMGGASVVQLGAIALLPTGRATQTAEEAVVAGVVASELLPFRVSNWGSGGGAGGQASVAHSSGDTGFGLSASYVVAREFEPVDGQSFAYRPGNQLRIRGAVDHNVGSSGKFTLSVNLERHSEDALDGTNLYRSGNRIQAVTSYSFAPGARTSAILYGGVFHRSQGTALLQSASDAPGQQLFMVGGGMRFPRAWGVLVPSVDSRVFRRDDGAGQGWISGAGVAAEIRMGGQTLIPAVRGRFGSVLVREGSESGITGLEFSLTTRLRGG